MKHAHLLRQAALTLVAVALAVPSQAVVTFEYLSNHAANKTIDTMVADLLDPSAVSQPANPANMASISLDGPTPEMKKYAAAHKEKLMLLDRVAIYGHPAALMMKCHMGTDARAPQWIMAEGIAWCTILMDEAPAAMGGVRDAARHAMDEYRKSNPGAPAQADARMLDLLHKRLAHPEQQGPIQSVDPVVVAKQDVPPEKLLGFAAFQFGRDFNDYINHDDLNRAIFSQQFAVAPGAVIKLDDYARFATAYNFDKTLARHPQLIQQALK